MVYLFRVFAIYSAYSDDSLAPISSFYFVLPQSCHSTRVSIFVLVRCLLSSSLVVLNSSQLG